MSITDLSNTRLWLSIVVRLSWSASQINLIENDFWYVVVITFRYERFNIYYKSKYKKVGVLAIRG